jgi:hypothetical protein
MVLAEISRITARKEVPEEKRQRALDFIRSMSLILSLDEDHTIKAGKIAEQEGLYLIDGIVYSYVTEYSQLLTRYKHFKGKPPVKLILKSG